jgi:CRP-like cAMP-binding protein
VVLENGHRIRVSTHGADGFFGAMGLLDDGGRRETAIADVDTTVHVLSQEHFEALVRDDQAIATKMLYSLSSTLSEHLLMTREELVEMEAL